MMVSDLFCIIQLFFQLIVVIVQCSNLQMIAVGDRTLADILFSSLFSDKNRLLKSKRLLINSSLFIYKLLTFADISCLLPES